MKILCKRKRGVVFLSMAAMLLFYGKCLFSVGAEMNGVFLQKQIAPAGSLEEGRRRSLLGMICGKGERKSPQAAGFINSGQAGLCLKTGFKQAGLSYPLSLKEWQAAESNLPAAGEKAAADMPFQEADRFYGKGTGSLMLLAGGSGHISGSWRLFLVALLSVTLLLADIRFSLVYLALKNCIPWKQEAPLEFCKFLQRVFHIVLGITALALLIAAVLRFLA